MKTEHRGVSPRQSELAHAVHGYLALHLDQHVSLAQLVGTFHVSGTTLKKSFREVYGLPLYASFKRMRMESAALCLLDSGDSIQRIAGNFGYENASKFSKAFRDVMGMSPREYRKSARNAAAEKNSVRME